MLLATDFDLTSIDEDNKTSAGNIIANLIDNTEITDPDLSGNALKAIALTNVDNSDGQWQYKINPTDPASQWQDVTGVSEQTALLLDSTSLLRFVPNDNFNGTVNALFRAWDQTDISTNNVGDLVDVSTNGGITPYSAQVGTFAIEVEAVDDPPEITVSRTTININEDETINFAATGNNVISFADLDIGASNAATVTLTATNGSLNLTSIPQGATVSPSSGQGTALTISGTLSVLNTAVANLQYIATPDFPDDTVTPQPGQGSIEIRIDDNGNTGKVLNGQTDTETININITAVNDAPQLLNTIDPYVLTGINEDATPNTIAGDRIADLIADSKLTDPDQTIVKAIALTNVDNSNGTWQYSLDGGNS